MVSSTPTDFFAESAKNPDHIGDANKMVSAGLPSEEEIDRIVTGLYRRFKDWSLRGFTADDVTWCEVRADVADLIRPAFEAKEREIERATNNRDMWKGQCDRQAKTLFDLRMQMLADEGQSRAGIDGWHEQIQRDASIDSPLNACCYRALAAEAALRSLRQAILDADIICDDDEKAGDRLSRLAAAIRAQGE